MTVDRLVSAERQALIDMWRLHRRAMLRLSVECDGFERAVEWLNSQLTLDDLAADLCAASISPADILAFLGERNSSHSSEPLEPEQREPVGLSPEGP